MKKFLASLLVLALCAPAMAATIAVLDNADGTATVTVSSVGAEAAIVGLALDVDVAGTGTVTDVQVVTPNFNIYPDAAYTQELGDGYAYGEGTPVAAKATAGEIALPQSSFALSLGNLNGAAIAGADGNTVVTIILTLADCNTLTVGENATRGGIVAKNGAALNAAPASADITGCATAAICLGDFNVDGVITGADVSGLLATFNKVSPDPLYNPIGDFNADGAVTGADIPGFIAVFNTPCP